MVMRVKMRVNGPDVDISAFQTEMIKGMTRLWDDSIAEFVREVAFALAPHIDTGMSIASLAPLGARVKLRSQIMAAASAGSKGTKSGGRFLGASGTAGRGFTKSISMGERLGENAFSIKYPTLGNYTLDFEFHIVVLQHFLHESYSNGASNSLNLKTIDKGRVALRKYFIANKRNPKYLPVTRKWLRLSSWVK